MNNDLHQQISRIIETDKENHLSIMHYAIVNHKFNTVVEFGVDRGTSTKAFLLASDKVGCKVFSFDIKDCSNILSHPNWFFSQVNDINKKKIFELFPEIIEKGIDLLYIDSYHEPNHIKLLLESYFENINVGGFIFVDDTSAYPYRKIKSLSNSIVSDLSREAVEEFYYSNFDSINFQYNGNENGLCILKKVKDSKVSKKKVWLYNFLIYNIIKLFKKIKYKIFYKKI